MSLAGRPGEAILDGSKVVFLVNPDITQYGAGEWKLGLLNGLTGKLLWQVSGAEKYLEPGGSYQPGWNLCGGRFNKRCSGTVEWVYR